MQFVFLLAALSSLCAVEPRFSPSLICGDMSCVERTIQATESALGDWASSLHVDIFDGEFAASDGFTVEDVRKIREITQLPLQIHIMAHDPCEMIGKLTDFLRRGLDTIIVHAEANECKKAVEQVRESGLLLGIALKAETDINVLDFYRDDLHTVLVFTVLRVGQRGQEIYSGAYERLSMIRQYLHDREMKCSVLVDGGVYEEVIRELALAGATEFVVGSSFYGRDGKGNSKVLLDKLVTRIASDQNFFR